jgi:hypothetical protein
VVAVGIILNVFSAYFRDAIDWTLSQVSNWWGNRTEAKRKQRQEKLNQLVHNKEAQEEMVKEEFRNRINATKVFVFSSLCLVLGFLADFRVQQQYSLSMMIFDYVLLILGLILMFGGISLWAKAEDQDLLVWEAKQRETPTVRVPGQKHTGIYPTK